MGRFIKKHYKKLVRGLGKSEQQTEHVQEYKRINTSKLFSNKEEEQSKYDKLYGLQVYDQVSPGSEVITYGN